MRLFSETCISKLLTVCSVCFFKVSCACPGYKSLHPIFHPLIPIPRLTWLTHRNAPCELKPRVYIEPFPELNQDTAERGNARLPERSEHLQTQIQQQYTAVTNTMPPSWDRRCQSSGQAAAPTEKQCRGLRRSPPSAVHRWREGGLVGPRKVNLDEKSCFGCCPQKMLATHLQEMHITPSLISNVSLAGKSPSSMASQFSILGLTATLSL